METKEEIRNSILAERNRLNLQARVEKNKQIRENILSSHVFNEAKSIMSYLSFGSEVETHELVKQALELGKEVVVPITHLDTNTLSLSELKDFSALRKNSLGILEPEPQATPTSYAPELDLILVPGAAFDRKGNRIGFGHGYYDRFLSTVSTSKAAFVGLGYDFQVVDAIPKEAHDVPLHQIVTESQRIEC